MTRRAALVVCAVSALACGGAPAVDEATSEFRSRPPGWQTGPVEALPTAGAAPSQADASTAAREVSEGDLYAWSGTTLLVLNGTRGLTTVDLSDPARPRLLARVPLAGRPVDLYVRDGVAVFAVSDWSGWAMVADGGLRPSQGAQLWSVDVRDPAAPVVTATVALPASLLTSRLVGDVLYTVGRSSSWSWIGGPVALAAPDVPRDEVAVASFDVSDPRSPRPVASVSVPVDGWGEVHAQATSARLTLALSGWQGSAAATRLVAFDLSDPAGALVAGASAVAPGRILDRFAIDHDATGVLRAVLDDGWNRGATVRTWDARDAAVEPAPLGALAIDVPETLTAARFDGGRAYVVTAVRSDPLWVVDVGDPRHPTLLGHLEMPGQLDYIEPRGDRLLALGHTDEAAGPWQLAVSLFDVASGTPRLLARVPFGEGFGGVAAERDDVRKAFQVLDEERLVVVPFQSWSTGTWRSVGGTQLVELGDDALAPAGFLPGAGAVLRAVPVPGRPGILAAFSEERLQIVDAREHGAPRELGALDLARPAWHVAAAGGAVVTLAGSWWSGAAELVVTPATDPDAPTPLSRVALDRPSARIFARDAVAWVLSEDWRDSSASLGAIDLADPASPRRRGGLVLRPPASAWGTVQAALSPSAPVLAVHLASWRGDGSTQGELLLVDLADPDRPAIAWRGAFGGSLGGDLGWDGARVRFTRWEFTSREDAWVRFFLERIDASDPRAPRLLPPVNVPGSFLAGSEDGRRIYTVEAAWERPEAPRTRVHALQVDGSRARLVATVEIDGASAGAVARDGAAWLVATRWEQGRSRARLHPLHLADLRSADPVELDAGWPSPLAVAGRTLLVATSSPSPGLLAFDLADPLRPTLASFTAAQGAYGVAADAERAYVAAGPFGVVTVPLTR